MILPVVTGSDVDMLKGRVNVPVVEANPGTLSVAAEKVAAPVPLAVPPVVIAGTLPEAMVSTITPLVTAVVHTM